MSSDTPKPWQHQPYTRDVPMSEANMIVRYVNDLEADLTAAQARVAELENALRPLVELNITYWDAQGEIRCNPGKTQQASMAIVHKARAALDSARGAG
jgi:hypothetical protein